MLKAHDAKNGVFAAENASDLGAVAGLARVVWLRCYPGIISLAQIHYMLNWMYALDTLMRQWRRGVRFDLCYREGNLAGFSSYGPVLNNLPVKMHKLYVHPEMQRKGVGGELLQQAETRVRQAGGTGLCLTVNKRNHPALCAYRKHGFQLRRSVVADIGGGFVMDDYVMVKDLPSRRRRA